jgi:Fic family protein
MAVYGMLGELKSTRKADLLTAHKFMMRSLIQNAGKLRTGSVGIVKGNNVEHLAPPAHLVPAQIDNLLRYLKDKHEPTLIKGCVFHYELEFIHPFDDGNGRMGRLWQTLVFMEEFPVFEFTPIEHVIKNSQKEYYAVLAQADREGHSTAFIEFMLSKVHEALTDLLNLTNVQNSFESRIDRAADIFGSREFSRLDYMRIHKTLSPSTASRDLKKAVDLNYLSKQGDKRLTTYTFVH